MLTLKILQHNVWYARSSLQKCLAFQFEPSKLLPVQNQQLEHKVWNMFSDNNKDTRATPLILLILNIVNIDIFNIKQLSQVILVLKLQLWTGNSLLGRMISQIKTLKIKYFLPFNFAITKTCVVIHLAEAGIRMGGI